MLQETDIANHALNALSNSGIREVHSVARRGFRDAAFAVGEFLALGHLHGVDGLLLAQRGAAPLAWKQWQTIDVEERRRGVETDRPRVKLVDIAAMLAAQ